MNDRGAPLLDASNLTYAIGDRILLNGISFTIHEKDRYGLIGRNGCGKSTLLKILSGRVEAFEISKIQYNKNLKVAYLAQDFEIDTSLTVLENIRMGAEDIYKLLKRYDQCDPGSSEMYTIQDQLTTLDGWEIDSYVNELISRLHCPSAHTSCEKLSGGEKRRVALAKVLISKPGLLILDEPTNHLDADAVAWLESWLKDFDGALIMITHDRWFLDDVCNRMMELRDGNAEFFPANYSEYLELRAEKDEALLKQDDKRKQFLKRELEWVRRSPKARTTKSQSRVDRYNDQAAKENFEKEADVDLIMPPAKVAGNVTINLEEISKAFGNRKLFSNLNIEIEPGAKIGLMGSNGVGKSTLLKIIMGELEADSGTVTRGASASFNYVDQNRSELNESNTVYAEVAEGAEYIQLGEIRLTARSYLRRFLFTDDRINTRVSELSGGERNRLLLARLLRKPCNFLILDEPTNDLDLSTLRVLEDALIHWKGCLMLVSHDRWFVNRICNSILAFEGNGQVTYQQGDYNYYINKKAEREAQTLEPKKKEIPQNPKPEAQNTEKIASRSKLSWKEARELESMEEKVLEIDKQINELEKLLNDPDFYTNQANQATAKSLKLEKFRKEQDLLYSRWEELEKIKNSHN